MINCSQASSIHTHTYTHRTVISLFWPLQSSPSSIDDSTRIWHCNFECQLIMHQFLLLLLLPSLSAETWLKKTRSNTGCTKRRYPAQQSTETETDRARHQSIKWSCIMPNNNEFLIVIPEKVHCIDHIYITYIFKAHLSLSLSPFYFIYSLYNSLPKHTHTGTQTNPSRLEVNNCPVQHHHHHHRCWSWWFCLFLLSCAVLGPLIAD